jgi:DNA-binding beta-propeller fold protein YncE
MKRTLPLGVASLVIAGASLLGQAPPSFQVDPLWPKPLPNHWLLGSVTGVAVDAQDHIWVVHRGYDSMTVRTEIGAATTPKTADACCVPAPPVLEFDAAGNLVSHWGGPGDKYEWPVSPGGISVDAKGNVWITAAGPPEIPGSANAPARGRAGGAGAAAAANPARGGTAPPKPQDAHVLKFSRTGEFLLQIGKAGTPGDNDSTTGLNKPAGVSVDAAGSEVYVADGFGNRRLVVFDANTGAYKRHWGRAGDTPFASVTCAKVAKDGTVYACDRGNNRVVAFDKTGKLLKEGVVSATTKGTGSVWDVAFSSDAQQRFLYVADGHDQKVFILRRDTLAVVGSFGDGGRYPGTFYSVGSVAVDSKGNVYTGENLEGKRVQKFILKGGGR